WLDNLRSLGHSPRKIPRKTACASPVNGGFVRASNALAHPPASQMLSVHPPSGGTPSAPHGRAKLPPAAAGSSIRRKSRPSRSLLQLGSSRPGEASRDTVRQRGAVLRPRTSSGNWGLLDRLASECSNQCGCHAPGIATIAGGAVPIRTRHPLASG